MWFKSGSDYLNLKTAKRFLPLKVLLNLYLFLEEAKVETPGML